MGKIRIYIEKCNKEKKIWYFYFVATFNVWFVKYCWYQLPTCRRNSSKKKEKMTQYFDLQWWCSEETGLHKLTGCCARRIALNRPLTAQPCWKGRLEEVNLPRKFNNNWRHSDAQTIRQELFQKEVRKVRTHFFSQLWNSNCNFSSKCKSQSYMWKVGKYTSDKVCHQLFLRDYLEIFPKWHILTYTFENRWPLLPF